MHLDAEFPDSSKSSLRGKTMFKFSTGTGDADHEKIATDIALSSNKVSERFVGEATSSQPSTANVRATWVVSSMIDVGVEIQVHG
jgi:hypothetical protein